MPIYGYECTSCGHDFDRLQKLSDPDPTDCPACSAQAVKRQVTAPAFRLAGSGWYETDFKKDGDKKRNLTDKGGPDKGPVGDGAGAPAGEAKPVAKSEGKSEAPSVPAAASSISGTS